MRASPLARLSVVASATAIIALLALHALRADLPPATHMISAYAVGRHGWVMTLCFYAFAAVLDQRGRLAGKRVGVLLTGGNVDLDSISQSFAFASRNPVA